MTSRTLLLPLALLAATPLAPTLPLIAQAAPAATPAPPAANPADVASEDAILKALYDVISGPAGQKRNWDRMRSLFQPGARLIPTGKAQDGSWRHRNWSVDEYITTAGVTLEERGFFEIEVARKTERYGNIVHVFSTYESRWKPEDAQPFQRGINSIQLRYDGTRWWVITVLWQGESPEFPIPEKYLR